MKCFLYIVTVIIVVSCEMRLPGFVIPTAPPSEASTDVSVGIVSDPYERWVKVADVILGKDSTSKFKTGYLQKHNYQLYTNFINVITCHSRNGWILRADLDNFLQTLYDKASRMPLDSIQNGQETFGGKIPVIRKNEIAYQMLIAKLTNNANDQGLVSREYAQRLVSEAYWKLKFSAWYVTAKLYAAKASTATRNFFDTSVAPRLRDAWNAAGSWVGQRRVQMSDWYRNVRSQNVGTVAK